jgi:primary-amine oxidase
MPSTETKDLPHPFDPLSLAEIETAINVVKKAHGDVAFNVVSLHEPRKAEMMAWLAAPDTAPRPARVADLVVIAPDSRVYDGLVDINEGKVTKWEHMEGVQPIVRSLSHALLT